MIRVSVLFPNQPGSTFDLNYYAEKHMALAKQRLESCGLIRIEVDKGISAPDPNAPAPFVAIGHLIFNSVEEAYEAFKVAGTELPDDRPNFTNIQPQIQISEILE